MNQQTEVQANYGLLFAPVGAGTAAQVLIAPRAGQISSLKFSTAEDTLVGGTTAELPIEDPAIAVRIMIDAAREEAADSARRELEAETEARVRAERARMIEVCEKFVRDRQRYFAAAEEQVVKLALAVAARVLHREAQADPLLLAGAVKAALARVQDGSAAVLRVPAGELGDWSNLFPPGSEPLVQLAVDERMTPGQCLLETVVGRVDLTVSVQLEEIARGFSELVQGHAGRENQIRD